jgi:hypothetical protein
LAAGVTDEAAIVPRAPQRFDKYFPALWGNGKRGRSSQPPEAREVHRSPMHFVNTLIGHTSSPESCLFA